MKKSVILSAVLLAGLVYTKAEAQVSIHLGVNIPVRRVYVPSPDPVVVYDTDEFDDTDEYYYLPEVEAYYSPIRGCYYYQDGGRWLAAQYLPGRYRNYNWRSAPRYEVRARRPYMHHDVYRNRWGNGSNRGDWYNRNNNYAGRNNNRYNDNNWNRRPDNNRRFDEPKRPDYRNNDNRGWGRNEHRDQPNRENGGWGNRGNDRPVQPNRENGGWGNRGNDRPVQPNRENGAWGNRGNDRPVQPNRENGRWGNRENDNKGSWGNRGNDRRERGNGGRPAQDNRSRQGGFRFTRS